MRDDYANPRLPTPPPEYSRVYMDALTRQLNNFFQQILSSGQISVTRINISDLPTSATGLEVGDLWNDSGTVKIVT